MILRTLHLSGFGVVCDQELADLAPGLNVIEGPNEAGKSTTVEFVRSLLFGLQMGQGKRIYEPLRGGEHGGWALVRDRQGRDLRWELKASKKSMRGVRLITELGGESAIDPRVFLGGADRKLYSSVFAFSLEEMAGLDTLQEDGVHARIYAAASGGGGASLFTAGRAVQRQLAELYRPGAEVLTINKLLRERMDLERELRSLGDGIDQYNEARRRHTEVQAELAVVRQEETAAREAFSRAEAAAGAWEPWLDLREVKAELQSLEALTTFPDEGLARLAESLQARHAHDERIADTEASLDTLERRLEECRLDQALLDARDTLHALLERQSEYLNARRDVAGIEAERDRAQQEGAEALARLGPNWSEHKLRDLDRSITREDEIRAHRDSLDCAQADVRAQEERLTTAQDHLKARQKQLDEAAARVASRFPDPPEAVPDYPARLGALEAADGLFRRSYEQEAEVRLLEERLDEIEAREEDRDSEIEALDSAPSPWLGLIGLVLCLGFAAIVHGNLPAQIGMVVLGVTLCGGWYWFATRQASGASAARKRRAHAAEQIKRQHESLRERHAELERALDGVSEQARTLLSPFGLTCDTPEAVRDAQRELAAAAQARERYESERGTLEALGREVESAKESFDRARRRVQSLKRASDQAQERWTIWMWERGLPTDASPETALRLFAEADRAAAAFRRRDDLAASVESKTAAIHCFEAEVRNLCRDLRRPEPRDEEVVVTLRTLTQQAEQQSKLLLQREELLRQKEAAESSLGRLKENAEILAGAHQTLLSLAKASDDEEFRRKAHDWSRKQALLARRQELDRRLDGISGPGSRREALEAILAVADPQVLAIHREEARRTVEDIEERRNRLQSDQGGLENELTRLEKSDQITGKQRELAAKDAEIAEASEQWAVLRLTSWLLERTRKKFETERQPAVIRNAGAMMSKLTGGRYSAVVAPEGLAEVALETPTGERKKLDAWSRGTREQLYLSLRFAFVQDYSSHAEPLPIIMDDVLVHADGYQRRRMAAETIAEVAQGCQVLYFTCHPDHAELLASACPGAHRYKVDNARYSRIA